MQLPITLEATLDTDTDVLYIYLRDREKDPKPINTMAINVTDMADLDENGNIVGFEMMNFMKMRDPKRNPYFKKRKPAPYSGDPDAK